MTRAPPQSDDNGPDAEFGVFSTATLSYESQSDAMSERFLHSSPSLYKGTMGSLWISCMQTQSHIRHSDRAQPRSSRTKGLTSSLCIERSAFTMSHQSDFEFL